MNIELDEDETDDMAEDMEYDVEDDIDVEVWLSRLVATSNGDD